MSQASLSDRQRGEIDRQVRERTGWGAGDYELIPLPEWDDPRLAIVVAIPTRRHDAAAPRFAVLPDGALVDDAAPNAFATIVSSCFTSPRPDDARTLAKLALLFGALRNVSRLPVGELVEHFPDPVDPALLPRANPEVSYTRQGKTHVIEFYSYSYTVRRLFDCSVAIGATGVEARAELVAASPDDAAASEAP